MSSNEVPFCLDIKNAICSWILFVIDDEEDVDNDEATPIGPSPNRLSRSPWSNSGCLLQVLCRQLVQCADNATGGIDIFTLRGMYCLVEVIYCKLVFKSE